MSSTRNRRKVSSESSKPSASSSPSSSSLSITSSNKTRSLTSRILSFFIYTTLTVATVIALVVTFIYTSSIYEDKGICPFDLTSKSDSDAVFANELVGLTSTGDMYSRIHGECYFSNDYYEARKKFLDNAKEAKALIKSNDLKLKDRRNITNVATDIAIVRGRSDMFILHISGTHGTEGYVGSAIQSAALKYLTTNHMYDTINDNFHNNRNMTDEEMILPTIIFVHALNPYGFAFNRRFNEDNIDVNRNFLKPKEFKEIMERDPNVAGYTTLNDVLNPVEMPFKSIILNDIYGIIQTAYIAVTVGIENIKKAMVTGTYTNPKGVYYGGSSLSESAKQLAVIAKALEIPERAKRLILIDIHSGLGPSGVDTLAILSSNVSRTGVLLDHLEKHFPTEYFGNTDGVSSTGDAKKSKKSPIGGLKESSLGDSSGKPSALSGYDLTTGTVTESFCNNYLAPDLIDGKRLCITQEFGTTIKPIVGKSIVDENYAYHYGSDYEKEVYGKRVKNSFYINTKKWKQSVLKRGLKVFIEALNYSLLAEEAVVL